MAEKTSIKLFEQKQVRSAWDEDAEKWYFSIVDVVRILTESPNARKYWSVLKTRLKKEGSQLATNCSQLKMLSADGKNYKTDVADTEQLFRLIQSIPSPKAEPFELWIAKVARERIDEIEDPEIGISRLRETFLLANGYRPTNAYIGENYYENFTDNFAAFLRRFSSKRFRQGFMACGLLER